jgi:RNA polymerase sigma factor (sigma-70 family)
VRDRDIVAAIIAADPAGLSAAYDRYAASLFSYCQSLLSEPADAADAVQDTFVIAAAKLSALRDPGRLRPWLYAVARNECRRRLRARQPAVPLDEAAAVTSDTDDLGSDLERAELRELVWSALAGLTESEREIIELSLGHELDGADLADTLGVPRNQAHAMASRARAHFEAALGVLLVARSGRDACTELDAMLAEWDGRLSVLLRKRISRHIRRCAICGDRQRRKLAPDVLFSALPVAVLPVSLRHQVLGMVADPSRDAAARRLAIGQRAGPLGPGGFPQPLDPPVPVRLHHQLRARYPLTRHPLAGQLLNSQPARAGAAAAGGVALIGGALLGGGLLHHAPAPPGAPGARPVPSASSGSAAAPTVPAAGGMPGAAGPGPRPAAAAHSPASAGGGRSGNGGLTAPPPQTPGGLASPGGAGVAGTLSVSPASVGLALSLGGSWTGTLTLTATGGPVRYQITVPAPYLQKLTVSAPSGQLAAGQSKRVTVTAASGGLFSTAILKLQPGGLGVTISYHIGV